MHRSHFPVAAVVLCVLGGGMMWLSLNQTQAEPSRQATRAQVYAEEHTAEVCLGNIVYLFGTQGNRSWMHPKIDAADHSRYITCVQSK